MSETEHDEQTPDEHEQNDLLKAQEGKGYGDDEGEREGALDDQAIDADEQ